MRLLQTCNCGAEFDYHISTFENNSPCDLKEFLKSLERDLTSSFSISASLSSIYKREIGMMEDVRDDP